MSCTITGTGLPWEYFWKKSGGVAVGGGQQIMRLNDVLTSYEVELIKQQLAALATNSGHLGRRPRRRFFSRKEEEHCNDRSAPTDRSYFLCSVFKMHAALTVHFI